MRCGGAGPNGAVAGLTARQNQRVRGLCFPFHARQIQRVAGVRLLAARMVYIGPTFATCPPRATAMTDRYKEFDGVSRSALIAELVNHRKALNTLLTSGYTVLQAVTAEDLQKYELTAFRDTLNDGLLIQIGIAQRDKRLESALDSADRHEYAPAPNSSRDREPKPAKADADRSSTSTPEASHER